MKITNHTILHQLDYSDMHCSKLFRIFLSSACPNIELVYHNHCYYDPQVVHTVLAYAQQHAQVLCHMLQHVWLNAQGTRLSGMILTCLLSIG